MRTQKKSYIKTVFTSLLKQSFNGSEDAQLKLTACLKNQLYDFITQKSTSKLQLSRSDIIHTLYFENVRVESVRWTIRTHFLLLSSRCMREVLVEISKYAEFKSTAINHLTADCGVGSINDLAHGLDALSGLNHQLVTVVECRYFGEMIFEDIAMALNAPVEEVKRDWLKARGWLYRKLASVQAEYRMPVPACA